MDHSLQDIEASRQRLGIEPDRLVVIELSSFKMDARDDLAERFQAVVVEERIQEVDGHDQGRLLVQFPSQEQIESFREEVERYRREEEDSHTLPQGLRQTFFDGIEAIRSLQPEERMGPRLKTEGWPEGERFALDVDRWHPGSRAEALEVLDKLRDLCYRHQSMVTGELRTTSLVLARVMGTRRLGDLLLELDLVARVDLPPKLDLAYERLFQSAPDMPLTEQPTQDTPLATIIDSGVLSGHPLLQGWVVEERDFDSGEGTETDRNGHGTGVAGLAVYGDIAGCIRGNAWRPRVQICSGKVLRHDPVWDDVAFPEDARPEAVVEEAIRYFHKERGCRVFNLSVGNKAHIYEGGRQFPWAEVLDGLARELDIVIVISAGNNNQPKIPDAATMETFRKAMRDQLLKEPSQRLCSPATAALALTVGSISRSEKPRQQDAWAPSPWMAPSVFTRVGPGLEAKRTQRAVKPELVAPGGNLALQAMAGHDPMWVNDLHLGELTLRLPEGGRIVGVARGTSFSAPQITCLAAETERTLTRALHQPPSANAIRAMLGACSRLPDCGSEWLKDDKGDETWEKLRLVGYGVCDEERLRHSLENDVCLFAEDRVPVDSWHLYVLPIPERFLKEKGLRGITMALAYDPPVRWSRREYLSRTMWIGAVKGLSADEIGRYLAQPPKGKDREKKEDMVPSLPEKNTLKMRPPRTSLEWSTLQVRRIQWQRAPGVRILNGQALINSPNHRLCRWYQ